MRGKYANSLLRVHHCTLRFTRLIFPLLTSSVAEPLSPAPTRLRPFQESGQETQLYTVQCTWTVFGSVAEPLFGLIFSGVWARSATIFKLYFLVAALALYEL